MVETPQPFQHICQLRQLLPGNSPIPCRPEVRAVRLQGRYSLLNLGSVPQHRAFTDAVREESTMPGTEFLTTRECLQEFQGILVGRPMPKVPRSIKSQQRFRDQRAEQRRSRISNSKCRLTVEASGKHRQSRKALLLRRSHQSPGMLEGGAEVTMARKTIAQRALKRIESALQSCGNLSTSLLSHSSSCQFHAERQALHQLADADNIGQRARIERKLPPHLPCPLLEKHQRAVGLRRTTLRRKLRVGQTAQRIEPLLP
ncbi:MAG: hypothetical protein BWY63_03304 [Chloroflexi bacterium ADurb.Bin360]|nr:MAG: hypothetical protein BWY63_03304 [Chloroflexi bacterium ADurb.Bin360]